MFHVFLVVLVSIIFRIFLENLHNLSTATYQSSCLRVSRFMSNSFARSIRLWPAGSFRFVAFEPFLQLVSTHINKLVKVYRQCYPTSILPSITSFSAFTIVPVNDTLGSCRTEWLARNGNMLISLVVVIDVMTFECDGNVFYLR